MSAPQRVIADRYRLRSLLGRGGAGSVWLARDERLDRDVAVKEIVFPEGLSDAERETLRARVLREARAAVRLDDAGAVTVFDVFDEGGRAYLIMEVIEAPSLGDLVRERGPLSPQRAAAIGLEVLATLRAAHAQGVVHRDVKPSNLIVPDAGRVRLTDFGIASVQGDPGLTATGLVLGSPSYMAPEQARDGRAGSEADLWGLGASLYFAVEGVAPFDRGGAIPTLTAVIHDEPRPMQRAGRLGPVIAALLAKDPADRPSPEQARLSLADVAEGADATAPTRSRRPAPAEPTVAYGRARQGGFRLAAALVGIGLVAVLAYVVGGPIGDERPATSQRPTAAGQRPATQGQAPTRPDRPEAAATPTPPSTASATAQGAAPPRDWEAYTDDAVGYTVVHPPQWEVIPRSDTITDFRDPATGTYLRVDWTDSPPASPEGAWQELSNAFAQSKSDYTEIQITPTTFRGWDAALWEYTYSEGGADLHATNLGFTDGEMGFALNFQTRAANWDGSRRLYEQLESGFGLPGSE